MAHKATNWAWELDLPMAQKFVLVALADMADEHLSCFPGQKRIAVMVGSSERTVRRALADLEELGLIEREARRSDVGYRTSDRYVLKVKRRPTGQIGRKSNRPNSPGTMTTVSPANLSNLTGHSDRAVEPPVEPLENHQLVHAQKRGTRIPDPFIVTASMRAWAADRTPLVNVDGCTERFVNYWRAKTRDATKLDWPATWRNWLLKDQEDALRRPGSKVSPTDRALATLALGREQKAVGA